MKFAFIVQRYGKDINGGAEVHVRSLVQKLKSFWEIEVWTSCAQDYYSWGNEFTPGIVADEGILVKRFPVDYPRRKQLFDRTYDVLTHLKMFELDMVDGPISEVLNAKLFDKSMAENNLGSDFKKFQKEFPHYFELKAELEKLWMCLQGPSSSELINHIDENKMSYDGFFFISYSYYTTYWGLQKVGRKSALIPTLHPEVCANFRIYQNNMLLPSHLIYNSKEEKRLCENLFPGTKRIPNDVLGVGIEAKSVTKDPEFIATEFKIDSPYIVYVGRVDVAKSCDDLIDNFIYYKTVRPSNLKLVLVGKVNGEFAEHQDVIFLGYLGEVAKDKIVANALAFVMPSRYESLSIALLEAWAMQIPVLANGKSQVLLDHVKACGGGYCYENTQSFCTFLDLLETNLVENVERARRGYNYALSQYNWNSIIDTYLRIGEKLSKISS